MNVETNKLYFCAEVKEIFSKMILSLDFFVSFFHQGKNENNQLNFIFFISLNNNL